MRRPCLLTLLAALVVLAAAVPAGAARGGPDAAGYTWIDSDEPGVPAGSPTVSSFTDLAATYGFTGDDQVIALALPPAVFPTGFPLYGARYSTLWLSSN